MRCLILQYSSLGHVRYFRFLTRKLITQELSPRSAPKTMPLTLLEEAKPRHGTFHLFPFLFPLYKPFLEDYSFIKYFYVL